MADQITSYQPHWEDDALLGPESWDTVFLGGERLPGRAKVKCPLKRSVEAKKAKGKCGGTITDNGEDITQVTISLEIATPAEWELWQKVQPKLWTRKKGGKRSPVSIEHPKTAVCGVTEVYLNSIDIGDPQNGVLTVEILASEWLIAPKDAPKPKPSVKTSPEEARYSNPSMRAIDDMFADPTSEAGRHATATNVDDIIAGTAPPLTEIRPSF